MRKSTTKNRGNVGTVKKVSPERERTSFEIQLEDEIKNLAPYDQELCRTLLLAIRRVQVPEWHEGHLPERLINALHSWRRRIDKAQRTDPARIKFYVEKAERMGLKRVRGATSAKSAYAAVAVWLGISESEVIKKTPPRKITRRARRR
jgi:hypothetical protein